MPPSFTTIFRSPNLTYHPLNSDPAIRSFIHKVLSTEPQTWAQSTYSLLKPLSEEEVDKHVERLSSCFLAAIIHLDLSQAPSTSSSENTPIGWLTLSQPPLSTHHRSCELGTVLSEPYQGKGYGTEAITWALDWAFGVAGLHSVRLECFSFNEGAARLYDRIGFKREGLNREVYWYGGRWWDRILFSMLEGEWGVLKARREGEVEDEKERVGSAQATMWL